MTLTLVGGNTPESLSPPPVTLFPGCGNARRSRRLIRQPKPTFGTSAIIRTRSNTSRNSCLWVEARVALLTIRKLSAQPRNHRYVDRVALGELHAQVDHLFRALVGDLHSAALGIAQTNDLGFCLAQHRGRALDLACRFEAERGSLGFQSLHQIGHGPALPIRLGARSSRCRPRSSWRSRLASRRQRGA